jgi:probable F420-dependent oxidoreductase
MDPRFGLAVRNFAPRSERLEFSELLDYARLAERLGFTSLWVWDHILLGTKRPFAFLEALSVLAGLSTSTERVRLGTGVLVLPLRNPVVLAKQTATIDRMSGGRLILGLASGWYPREFEAVGVPFKERGRVFSRNFDILLRFWTGDPVEGSDDGMVFRGVAMLPPPVQRPRPTVLFGGYVDRVLRRVATRSDGWLTYFYTPESFRRAWTAILRYAEEAGRDPSTLQNMAQLPICVDRSFERADRRVRSFVERYFDVAPWSESTADSAIRGAPDDCAEQIDRHLRAGVQHVVFVPCDYDTEQVEAIATDVLPRLESAIPSSQ